MPDTINAIATALAELRFERRTVAQLPEDARPTSLAQAYAAQDALVTQLLARHGGHTVGYKTACTNALARAQLKVSHPLVGQLLSYSTHAAPVILPADDFTLRTIEPEFGFRMGADAPAQAAPYTAESITALIADAFAGIEIVDHRFHDWSAVGAATIAADNAIHGAYVQGMPCANWRQLDLVNQQVTLTVNGARVREGNGAAVLGSPFTALAWLANELLRFGKLLKAGDVITTGVVCDVYAAQCGDDMTADFGPLGSVRLGFN